MTEPHDRSGQTYQQWLAAAGTDFPTGRRDAMPTYVEYLREFIADDQDRVSQSFLTVRSRAWSTRTWATNTAWPKTARQTRHHRPMSSIETVGPAAGHAPFGKIPDVREQPFGTSRDSTGNQATAAIRRRIVGRSVTVLPVAAFQSAL